MVPAAFEWESIPLLRLERSLQETNGPSALIIEA